MYSSRYLEIAHIGMLNELISSNAETNDALITKYHESSSVHDAITKNREDLFD